MKKKQLLSLLFILLLALVSAAFIFPQYVNRQIDAVNAGLPFKVPHLPDKAFKLGLDVKGGVHLEYEADLNSIPEEQRPGVMDGVRDMVERRINIYGVSEPQIQKQGDNRLIVELPGVDSIQQAIDWIGATPWLEFSEQRTEEETKKITDKIKEVQGKPLEEITKIPDFELAFQNPFFKPTELTGKYLKRATATLDENTGRPIIELQFNDEGKDVFAKVTERNVQKPLAIYLDGRSIIDTNDDNKIDESDIYAPIVEQKISDGKAMISGSALDVKTAQTIARRLNEGALPVPLGQPITQQKIGPTLGAVSLEQVMQAGFFGFLLVVIFMVFYYRLPGLLASVALVFYAIVLLAIFKLFGVTMSLAAIGGFILSVGMAVDANVLIFSRMKEELQAGNTLITSIKEGFKRAFPAIRDGNLTTMLVALILFIFGTSFVKGFAITLFIGIGLSMYSAIVVTRTFLRVLASTKLGKWAWLWKPLA